MRTIALLRHSSSAQAKQEASARLELVRANNRLAAARRMIDQKDALLRQRDHLLPEQRAPATRGRPPALGAIAAPAAATSSQHAGDYDARYSDRNSGDQSAQSKCGSFGASDLEEDFPSEVAEEEIGARKLDKGGVDSHDEATSWTLGISG